MSNHEPRKAGTRNLAAQGAYASEVVHSVSFITRQPSEFMEQGSGYKGAILLNVNRMRRHNPLLLHCRLDRLLLVRIDFGLTGLQVRLGIHPLVQARTLEAPAIA